MFYKALGQTLGHEVVKRAVGSSVRIRKTSVKILEELASSQTEGDTTSSLRAGPEVFSRKRKKWQHTVGYSGRADIMKEQCGIFAHSKNCGARETAIAR
jgi:hypothetical protein